VAVADDKPTDETLQRSMNAGQRIKAKTPAKEEASAVEPDVGNVARALTPAAKQRAARQVAVNDAFPYEVAFQCAFLGSGQGGSRIADSFYQLGYRRVAVFNTTDRDFYGISTDIPTLSFDIGGAAKDAGFAAQHLKGRDQEVWDLMLRAWGNVVDYALVCVSLGGGTGSGTVSGLVQMARKYMESKGRTPRVGAIISLPQVDEGQQTARNTVIAFQELLTLKASPLIIIDNKRIDEVYDKPGFADLYPIANKAVSQLFHLFNQLAASDKGTITFDQSELAQLLDSGIVVMGATDIPVAEIKSPADISTRIREDLANSVLAAVDIKRGRKGACLFVSSRDVLKAFSSDFFAAGFDQLERIVGSAYGGQVATVIHRGVYPVGDGGLQCYTMISELDPPRERLGELARKAGLDVQRVTSSIAAYLGVGD
jgi:cell division GTPase FtsZ